MRGLVHLRLLAFELVERLVVGTFGHDVCDLVTEHDLDLVVRGLRVFDRVMQQRRGQHDGILHVRLHQDVSDLNRMIDVRRGFLVLAFQKSMLLGRESGGLQNEFHVGRHHHRIYSQIRRAR